MKQTSVLMVAAALPWLLLASPDAAQSSDVFFFDGDSHTIDTSMPTTHITVRDGPGWTPTIVDLVTGGRVRGATLYDSSVLNIRGVVSTSVDARGQAVVNMFSGHATAISIHDESTAYISGGDSYDVRVDGNGVVRMTGGNIIDELYVEGTGKLIIAGGHVEELEVQNSGYVEIYGGSFGDPNGDIPILQSSGSLPLHIFGSDFAMSDGYLYGILSDGNTLWVAVPDPDSIQVHDFVFGDLTDDGTVNRNDLAVLASNFGMTAASVPDGDHDFDGRVGLSDLAVLKSRFGESTIASPNAVPEPSSVTLALLAFVSLLAWRLRRRTAR